jgi:uncharacterized membrane protein
VSSITVSLVAFTFVFGGALLGMGLRSVIPRVWANERRDSPPLEPMSSTNESLYDKIQALSPKDEAQTSLKSQALSMAMSFGQARWIMYEQQTITVSRPLVVVMIFWLTIIFVSWGLFAPPNRTVFATLFAAAVSVSGAIFLILEMYNPYGGVIRKSSAPLRAALAHLGQ